MISSVSLFFFSTSLHFVQKMPWKLRASSANVGCSCTIKKFSCPISNAIKENQVNLYIRTCLLHNDLDTYEMVNYGAFFFFSLSPQDIDYLGYKARRNRSFPLWRWTCSWVAGIFLSTLLFTWFRYLVREIFKFNLTILLLEQILQLQLHLPYQSAVAKSLENFTLCSYLNDL